MKMNASPDSQSHEWGWGYFLSVKPIPITIQSLRFLLVLHQGCSAWAHVADVKTGVELAKSQPAPGKGGGEEWYHFSFGSTVTGTFQQQWIKLPEAELGSESIVLAIFVHCSSPGPGRPPNRLVYVVDHRSGRPLNSYMMVDAASFDGNGHGVRKSRHLIGELTVVPADGFDLNEAPPMDVVTEDNIDDAEATLAAEIERMLGEKRSDTDFALEQKRVKLRRMALDYANEPFERRLGPMPDRKLFLDVPARSGCAYNFLTEEYWVVGNVEGGRAVHVWCCGLDGALRRTLRLDNVPHIYSLSFDRCGNFYMCDSERSCYAFRPAMVQAAVAERFLRCGRWKHILLKVKNSIHVLPHLIGSRPVLPNACN